MSDVVALCPAAGCVHASYAVRPLADDKHVPFTAKHPVFPAAVSKLIPPPWKVEVAVVEAKRPVVPAIESNVEGDVVPMPRFPPCVRENNSEVPAES